MNKLIFPNKNSRYKHSDLFLIFIPDVANDIEICSWQNIIINIRQNILSDRNWRDIFNKEIPVEIKNSIEQRIKNLSNE